MQPLASQQHKQWGRIPRRVMVMSCNGVIASLLIWSSSVGGANDNSAPVKISAVPAQPAGSKEASADKRGGSSNRPTRPTCAELGAMASTQESERTVEASSALGCGVRSNVARSPLPGLRGFSTRYSEHCGGKSSWGARDKARNETAVAGPSTALLLARETLVIGC
jgi:hypothetical protein